MLTLNDLATYHVGLELTDLFGKGRIRELLYDTKLRIAKDEEEIETWRMAYLEQSKAIKGLIDMKTAPSLALSEENERLKKELTKTKESLAALQEYCEAMEMKLMAGKKFYKGHWIEEETA